MSRADRTIAPAPSPNKIQVLRSDQSIKFENVSGDWAGVSLYNSNGVATADFDNDGDLDFVTNNMDAAATLYESKAQDQ